MLFFLADGRPKVLFFEYVDDENERRELHKKIWNAQIPIIIFTDFNCIKIFSGINMKICKLDDYSLLKIGENEISECNELSAFSYWSITNEQFLRQYQSKFYISTLNEVMIDNIKYKYIYACICIYIMRSVVFNAFIHYKSFKLDLTYLSFLIFTTFYDKCH